MEGYIEVQFNKYCNKCKYKSTPEVEDPCNRCLHFPATVGGTPIEFRQKGKKEWTKKRKNH